jgi:hypothetical protein
VRLRRWAGGRGPADGVVFLGPWLRLNMGAMFPGGGVEVREELRSTSYGLHKRADAVLYMTNVPGCVRYVLLEADNNEHKRLGLVEDIFRVNWFVNEWFPGGKVYVVVRVNLDGYELGNARTGGTCGCCTCITRRTGLRRWCSGWGAACGWSKRTHSVVYRPHEDPGYLEPLRRLR